MGSIYPIAQINTMFICLFSISHSYCKNILYLQTIEGLGVITFSQTEAPLFYSVSQCCKMQIKNLPASNLVLKLPIFCNNIISRWWESDCRNKHYYHQCLKQYLNHFVWFCFVFVTLCCAISHIKSTRNIKCILVMWNVYNTILPLHITPFLQTM